MLMWVGGLHVWWAEYHADSCSHCAGHRKPRYTVCQLYSNKKSFLNNTETEKQHITTVLQSLRKVRLPFKKMDESVNQFESLTQWNTSVRDSAVTRRPLCIDEGSVKGANTPQLFAVTCGDWRAGPCHRTFGLHQISSRLHHRTARATSSQYHKILGDLSSPWYPFVRQCFQLYSYLHVLFKHSYQFCAVFHSKWELQLFRPIGHSSLVDPESNKKHFHCTCA